MRDDSGLNRSTIRYLIAYAVLVSPAVIVNLPGRAQTDAIHSIYQAGHLDALGSWHAPFVTFSYGLLAPLTGSPTGALIIQSLLLMLWPAAITIRILEAQYTETLKALAFVAWGIICMMLVALAGYVEKDVLLLGFLSAILATFMGHRRQRELQPLSAARGFWIFFCILAFCLVRPTNILLLACAALLVCLNGLKLKSVGQRLGVAGGVTACIWVSTFMVNAWLLPAPSSKPERATFMFDIAGISFFSGENVFENISTDSPPKLSINDCYSPVQIDNFIWGPCKEFHSAYWNNITLMTWAQAIVQHPLAYARHRMAFAKKLLFTPKGDRKTITPPPPFIFANNAKEFLHWQDPPVTIGLQLWTPTIAYLPFGRVAHHAFTGPLGRPWLWMAILALASACLLRLPRSDDRTIIAALIATGLSNVAMLIIFSPGSDLRYLLPTAFCALVVSVKLVELGARRWIPRKEPLA